MRPKHKLAGQLADLETLDRAALATRWEAHMRRRAPKASSRMFLLRALSYELQSKHVAGLTKADLKRLNLNLENHPTKAVPPDNEKTTVLRASPVPKSKREPSVRTTLVAGSRLVREWNGQAYTVLVIKEGFVYRDRTWNSLSAIAKDITGAHWSGPRFFGLDKTA